MDQPATLVIGASIGMILTSVALNSERFGLWAEGYSAWLAGRYVDFGYLRWRGTWDTTEEQDYVLGYSS